MPYAITLSTSQKLLTRCLVQHSEPFENDTLLFAIGDANYIPKYRKTKRIHLDRTRRREGVIMTKLQYHPLDSSSVWPFGHLFRPPLIIHSSVLKISLLATLKNLSRHRKPCTSLELNELKHPLYRLKSIGLYRVSQAIHDIALPSYWIGLYHVKHVHLIQRIQVV